MISLLQTLLEEFNNKITAFQSKIKRTISLPNILNKATVVIGMRRTGKTYLLLQLIEILLKNNIPLTRILYINFEDDRLYPVTQEKLRELLDGFYTLFPDNHQQECYLFLDEIQNVDHWPAIVRRYLDTKKVKLYLTGSSAKLLSKEIATSLRGRSFAIEVWPFNFIEFLQAQQLTLPKTLGQVNLDKMTHLLNHYLEEGGFPEIIVLQESQRLSSQSIGYNVPFMGYNATHWGYNSHPQNIENQRQILQDYVSVVITRDIIERHQISNPSPLRYIIKCLLKNVGCTISINKLYNDLKSQNFEISKNTIHHYLDYIEDAYLAFLIPIYSESIRQIQTNPKKIYAVDTGLAYAYTIGFSKNKGHYFENLVYLDLRRARHTIYYYLTKTRQEVDFLTLDLQGKWHLFQVCWNMEDTETFKREITALEMAKAELNLLGLNVLAKCITPATYLTDFLPSVCIPYKL